MRKLQLLIPITVAVFLGCTASQPTLQTVPIPDDRNPIDQPPPGRNSINDFADAIDKQFANPIENSFDLPRQFSRLTKNRKEAFNVNAFDDVENSAWFTHRHPYQQMGLDELYAGPDGLVGPDTSGIWIIVRAKADGVTPGFAIKDQQGNRFFIKFDPPGYSELASGAEVVATKIFYAAGYFTPENYIVTFDPRILRMGEGVKLVDEKGRKRHMTEEDLEEILTRVEYLPDGRLRALASRYVPGKPVGPFRYEGTVKQDPNDFVPHQHRRELRGLYVLGSWLNHIDSKAQNSLDSYVTEENGDQYVRHYLIDFGTCLGSGGRGPHPGYRGHENEIDPGAMVRKILTLGLYVRQYEKPDSVLYPSIGRYSNDGFHPEDFHSIFPNPAYSNMTLRDAYWGARMVASFSDEDLATIVQTGQYSDPEAEKYLLQQMIERRDIICRYWFDRMPPLDYFEVSGSQELHFEDLAIKLGLEDDDVSQYSVYFGTPTTISEKNQAITEDTRIALPSDFVEQGGGWVSLRLRRGQNTSWSNAVHLYLSSDTDDTSLQLTGIVREEK